MEVTSDTKSYIHSKAALYGAQNPSLVLTTHQKKMNEESQGIALANPSLLNGQRKMVISISMEKAGQSTFTHRVIRPHLVVRE